MGLLPFLAAAAAAAATLAAAASSTVDQHRGHDRLLIVFAPDAASPGLVAQRHDAAAAAASYADRDLITVEVIADRVSGGDDAATLRRRFRVPPGAFRAVLVGKDGHIALSSPAPLTADRLTGAIDAMPMRQDELRRRRPGA